MGNIGTYNIAAPYVVPIEYDGINYKADPPNHGNPNLSKRQEGRPQREQAPERLDMTGAAPDVMMELVKPLMASAGQLVNCHISSMADLSLQCQIKGKREKSLEIALIDIIERKELLFSVQEFYYRQLHQMSKAMNSGNTDSVGDDKPYSAQSQLEVEKQVRTSMASLYSQKSVKGTAEYAESLMKENVKLRSRLKNDTRQILIQETLDIVKPLRDEDRVISDLMERNGILIDRLAAEMNAKISQDESALENISLGNRPMKIAEEYSLLTSNAWLDAKTELDTYYRSDRDEDEKVKLLCSVLLEAETQAANLYNNFTKAVNKQLQYPLQYKPGKDSTSPDLEESVRQSVTLRKKNSSSTVLPVNVETSIGDFLKTTADFVELSTLYKCVDVAAVSKYSEVAKMTERVALDEYIKQCARLGWKMAIQRPKMRFDYDENIIGQPFPGDKRFDLAWGSEPRAKGASVRYYKHPPLYHGDKQMIKGSVLVS